MRDDATTARREAELRIQRYKGEIDEILRSARKDLLSPYAFSSKKVMASTPKCSITKTFSQNDNQNEDESLENDIMVHRSVSGSSLRAKKRASVPSYINKLISDIDARWYSKLFGTPFYVGIMIAFVLILIHIRINSTYNSNTDMPSKLNMGKLLNVLFDELSSRTGRMKCGQITEESKQSCFCSSMVFCNENEVR
ncbi:hypothetical protein ACOME3_000347 [Neoechinorhynchus agilis]